MMDYQYDNLPLVSVIVPAYNHECFVEKCLNSIIAQTYKNMQIIIINDGSTDNTEKCIQDFMKKINFPIEFVSKDNEGICKTLNLGIQLSKGEYIATIASDDIWLPEKLAKQIDFLENNQNIGLVYSDIFFLKKDGNTELKFTDYKSEIRKCFLNGIQNAQMYYTLLTENIIIANTVMIRKKCLDTVGYYDENIKFEDYDMWLRFAQKYPIGFIDEPLAYYRIHDDNISHNSKFMISETYKALKKQYKSNIWKKNKVKKTELKLLYLCKVIRNRVYKKIFIRGKD